MGVPRGNMPSNRPRITVYVDDKELKAEIEALAKRHRQTVSSFVLSLCEKALEEEVVERSSDFSRNIESG